MDNTSRVFCEEAFDHFHFSVPFSNTAMSISLSTDFQICFEMFYDNEFWEYSIQNMSLLPNLTWSLFWLVKNATSLSYQKHWKNLPTIFATSVNKILKAKTTKEPNTWNEKVKPMLRNGKYHDIVNRVGISTTDWLVWIQMSCTYSYQLECENLPQGVLWEFNDQYLSQNLAYHSSPHN